MCIVIECMCTYDVVKIVCKTWFTGEEYWVAYSKSISSSVGIFDPESDGKMTNLLSSESARLFFGKFAIV